MCTLSDAEGQIPGDKIPLYCENPEKDNLIPTTMEQISSLVAASAF